MRNPLARWAIIASLLFGASLPQAREATPAAANPAIEARLQSLAEELRCLVCQNQNLADSHAELAIDLKNQIREMLQKGMSDKEVVDFLVQRYGDFVLYRPPVKTTTSLLWIGPFLLFLGGLGVLFVKLRNRRNQDSPPLSTEEKQAATRLLMETEGKDKA